MWNSSSDRALTQDSCAAKDCSFTGRRSAVLPRSTGDVSYVPIGRLPIHQCFFADRRPAPGAGDEFIYQVVRRGRIGSRDFIQNPIEGEFGVAVAEFTREEKGSSLRPCPLSDNENPELT